MAYHKGEGLGQGSPGLSGIGGLGLADAKAGMGDWGIWVWCTMGVSIFLVCRGAFVFVI